MIKVLLADDHQMFIDGMQSFLEKEKSIEVVGEALNGVQVLEFLNKQTVDVIVLDIKMPELDGLATIKGIKTKYPKTKILMLTMHEQSKYILRSLKEQANGYILKDRSKEELVGAIHAVYNGNSYYPPSIMDNLLKGDPIPDEDIQFTPKELEVLKLLAKGRSDKEIASDFFISEKTVHKHCSNMRKKTGTKNRIELINYGRDKGLL